MNIFSRESLQDPVKRKKQLYVIVGLLALYVFLDLDDGPKASQTIKVVSHEFYRDFNDPRVVGVLEKVIDSHTKNYLISVSFYNKEQKLIKVVESQPIHIADMNSQRSFEVNVSNSTAFDHSKFLNETVNYQVDIYSADR